MQKIKKFFWLCSGFDISLLNKTPTESTKYSGIGATIFFTGLLAGLAAAYAMYTVFDNAIIATSIGIIWGLMGCGGAAGFGGAAGSGGAAGCGGAAPAGRCPGIGGPSAAGIPCMVSPSR